MITRIRQRLDNSATYWKIRVASEVFIEKAMEQLYCLCHSPKDMASREIAGLQVGMSQETVARVVETLPGVIDVHEKRIASKLKQVNQRMRAIYLDFEDDRFLAVSFSETRSGNRVCELSLVYQEKSLVADLLEKTIREYGRPDFKKSKGGVTQAAWGGRATDQGAVVPYKGVSTTLSAELISNRQLSLSLVGHSIIAQQL